MKIKKRTKWGKNYKKPTRSFKKACLMNSLRESLFIAIGLPPLLKITSRNEGKWNSEYFDISRKIDEDIKEMRKMGIQFADSLPRKAKKRFKKGLSGVKHIW